MSDDEFELPSGYEFVRSLGAGGLGRVALARQAGTNRLVAVKLISPQLLDAESEARLQREGQAVAALHNPHIVQVHQLVPSAAGLALVMEYVPGGDVGRRLHAGTLSRPEGVRLLRDAADALAHAAELRIVHRDVKPANLLIDADGGGKLADFGLARLSGRTDAFRTVGAGIAGTPAYMAPEQITDPQAETPASDVYALSVLAYELLLGARPFAADELPALLYAHLHLVPTRPAQLQPGVPPGLENLLLAGLDKRADRRPTARQFVRHLDELAGTDWAATGRGSPVARPISASPISAPRVAVAPPAVPSPPGRGRGSRRATGPRPGITVLLLGIAAGAAVGLVLALVLTR